MNKIYLIAGLVLAGGMLHAQTNVTDTPNPPRPPTLINSDHADFDLTVHRAVYWDNVRVDDPQMILTCVRLTADLPPSQAEAQLKHIVAETNVVIDSVDEKGQTNHATSDKAIYHYEIKNGVTNETVTLTGNARMQNSQGILTGEPIIWDRINNHLTAINQKMVVNQNIGSALINTNSTPHKTNSPPRTPDLPLSKTNLPPGTIQNIDRITNHGQTQ
ncbi:MAG TPA: LptA/OstA family protein [Verrucomicrobiae bacterium]|nr:LptA/OstA family protein [Verrucomicrobiae bacterium]